MAIAPLLDALEREAAADLATIAATARGDADRTIAVAAAAREARGHAALARAHEARRAETEAVLAAAARRGRRAVLAARTAALDRVRAAVLAGLPALIADPAAGPLVARLIEALVATAGDEATVSCPPALAGAVRAAVAGHPGLAVAIDPGAGAGVRAVRAGSRVTVDATLESMFERLWPRLRQEVAP